MMSIRALISAMLISLELVGVVGVVVNESGARGIVCGKPSEKPRLQYPRELPDAGDKQ